VTKAYHQLKHVLEGGKKGRKERKEGGREDNFFVIML
jgi:hypothetical protein